MTGIIPPVRIWEGSNSYVPTVAASEKNPTERFDELLASYSNSNERSPHAYQQSLVYLLRRFLNHMTKGQRNDLLLRFGAALSQRDVKDIDFKSLSTIVSSDEDVITLFHTDPAESDHTFSTRPTRPTFRNLPPALLDVLCNELMACVILGIGDEVYETIVTNFTTFSESISREQTERHWQKLEYSCFQKIVEISQNCIDPVERIASFINNLPNKTMPVYEYGELYPMNLLSQCLRHSATFLNGVPF
ncbi:hypothetical protein BLNAU_3173 [Blattamonas nauphoetae]|uniref:Uncharacterized protein n=1 Tax=Blattamonas nauphoetae TaxID=2049346 RepID=A0ABQ9YD98_9EUKA|nr:hypothetical protein BLNAU_3173 [Blattamonas nauphoetae]